MISKKVLVVAPHPDDESLGCGGTLLKLKKEKAEIFWLILTSMDESSGFSSERIRERQKEIDAVAKAYDFDGVVKLNFPVSKLDQVPMIELVEKIGAAIQVIEPDTVFVQNRSDAHSDHRVSFFAVMSCVKSFRYSFVKKVCMYETISETEFSAALSENAFVPNFFVDISSQIEKKIKILSLYKSEFGKHPFPRSFENVKALAHFRGAMVNVTYAESFMLLKEIN